ncbi:MAG TPA: RND transporter [Pirellulales bacterium]|nr:RND transporter [Pirellulales bacterium]
MLVSKYLVAGWFALLAVGIAGCGKTPVAPAPETQSRGVGHGHESWWCDEHGVPEEVCAQCDNRLVAQFKAKDDWCQEHDRPESQCFICHPEFQEKFAAQYEAKYGRKPPKPEAEEPREEEEHEHDMAKPVLTDHVNG